MTTFDLANVREFTTGVDLLNECDNGEGMECANFDFLLGHSAECCNVFVETVRRWGREVFAGRVAYDAEVENLFKQRGHNLHAEALGLLDKAHGIEISCFEFDHQPDLQIAVLSLDEFLRGWVTPRLAVSPSARLRPEQTPEQFENSLRRLESLSPLPADWEPAAPDQRSMYRRLRNA